MRRRGRRGRAGFTLLEMMISTVVLAILLDAVLNGALMIAKGATFGDKRARLAAKVAHALDRMSAEINLSSTDIDTATGLPYMSVAGVENDETLTFKRVVGFGINAGELQPIWSTDIVYELDDNGAVTRTQDGVTTIVCSGATQLGFEIESTGRVLVLLAATADPDRVAPDTLMQEVPIPTSF
jgi:prepilin-type N-terminal cleavage/methylation domain-containing protein